MKYNEIQSEICEKQQLLAQTDYIDNKLTEAMVIGSQEDVNALRVKYGETLVNRRVWRERISELNDMTPDPEEEPVATEEANEG